MSAFAVSLEGELPARVGSAGLEIAAIRVEGEHGFGLQVTRHWRGPERASVSLRTYTLDGLEHGEPFADHVRLQRSPGEAVATAVEAGTRH